MKERITVLTQVTIFRDGEIVDSSWQIREIPTIEEARKGITATVKTRN